MKKGLSSVLAVIFIILLVVVAVAIIWISVLPLVRDNLKITNSEELSIITSEGWTVYDAQKEIACVQVKKIGNASLIKQISVSFLIEGNSLNYSVSEDLPNFNEVKTYCFNLTGKGVPGFVSIYSVYLGGKLGVGASSELSKSNFIRIPNYFYSEVVPNFSCTYYASPDGNGDGSFRAPFKIANFWSVVKPGDTLCLKDGIYKGADSMIVPSYINGSQDKPITIKAINEGNVLIDGEKTRYAIFLWACNWFILEGMNARNGAGGAVVMLGATSHTIVRRVVAWDANDAYTNIFYVNRGDYNLLEDCAGFGIADKTYSTDTNGNNNVFRRCWGRWEGSHIVSPKMTYTTAYNSYNNTFENCLATWDGIRMNDSYVLLSQDGTKPCYLDSSLNSSYPACKNLTSATLNFQVDQASGLLSVDKNFYGKNTNTSLLGCIAYLKSDAKYPTFEANSFIYGFNLFNIKNTVYYAYPNVKALSLYTFDSWKQSNSYVPDNYPRYSSVLPTARNGHYYECVKSGKSGLIEPSWFTNGSNTTDGTVIWKDAGLVSLNVENVVTISNRSDNIYEWTKTNYFNYTYANYPKNVFTSNQADVCHRYENGVLTNKPLWPWPMEKRIWDAMTLAGYDNLRGVDERVNVTKDVEDLLGTIPSQCRG